MDTAVIDDIERFAAEHFQLGVCLPADCGIRPRSLIGSGRNFIPGAFDEFRRVAKDSLWWQETLALSRSELPVTGRPENVRDFRQHVQRRREIRDKQKLLDLLKNLQAERLALEKEFAARAEELTRRD